MPNKNASQPRFLFRGNSVPLGGRIVSIGDNPAAQPVPTPCTSSLPWVGGFSRGDGAASSWQDIFSWGPCVAESKGEALDDGSRLTTVTSSATGVTATNKPFRFEAGELTAVVTSKHPMSGLPSIVLEKIVLGGDKGMFLDRKRIEVKIDLDDFQKFPAFDAFEKKYRTDEKFFRKYSRRFQRTSGKSPQFGERLPRRSGGNVLTSIANGITWGNKKIRGNVLTLSGFGSIHFGELLMNEYARRLTLVRLMMGSEIRAEMEFAGVDTNGSFEP
jgi:hypothetical protein